MFCRKAKLSKMARIDLRRYGQLVISRIVIGRIFAACLATLSCFQPQETSYSCRGGSRFQVLVIYMRAIAQMSYSSANRAIRGAGELGSWGAEGAGELE